MINLKVKDNIYKCVLDVSAIMSIEQELDTNPVNVFIECQSGKLPKLKDIHIILHYSLARFNHGLNLNDTKNILAEYMTEQGLNGLIEFMSELFKTSGLIKLEDENIVKNEKTAVQN